MKASVPALLSALFMASCAVAPAMGQGTVTQETDHHPYTYALQYCQDRGGLARYTVSGSTVKFSCADDIANVITINT